MARYPTLPLIKLKKNIIHWERQNRATILQEKRLEEHGTVNACMTSLTERAQGGKFSTIFFAFFNL